MFDVSSAHSFNRAKEWVYEIRVGMTGNHPITGIDANVQHSDRPMARRPSLSWWATRQTCPIMTQPHPAWWMRRYDLGAAIDELNSAKAAIAFAEANSLLYFETSAKTGLGITQLFTEIGW